MTATRRLAAILAADVAGYSRLIGADEGGTLQGLKTIRAELFDPTIAAHHGRLDESKKALKKAIAIAPASFEMYVRGRAPSVRPENHAHMLEGLRKAGLPEE